MKVFLQRTQSLEVPETLTEGEHVRLWVAGYVKGVDKHGKAYVVTTDWQSFPKCHRCGARV